MPSTTSRPVYVDLEFDCYSVHGLPSCGKRHIDRRIESHVLRGPFSASATGHTALVDFDLNGFRWWLRVFG